MELSDIAVACEEKPKAFDFTEVLELLTSICETPLTRILLVGVIQRLLRAILSTDSLITTAYRNPKGSIHVGTSLREADLIEVGFSGIPNERLTAQDESAIYFVGAFAVVLNKDEKIVQIVIRDKEGPDDLTKPSVTAQ